MRFIPATLVLFVAVVGFVACSGGGSTGPFVNAPIILASVPPSNSITVGPATSTSVAAGFATIKVQIPVAASGGGNTMIVTGATNVPGPFPPFTGGTPIAYVLLYPQANMSFHLYPTLTLTLPQGSIVPGSTYAAAYISNDPKSGATSWVPTMLATGVVSGQSVAFPGGTAATPVSLTAFNDYVFCIYQE